LTKRKCVKPKGVVKPANWFCVIARVRWPLFQLLVSCFNGILFWHSTFTTHTILTFSWLYSWHYSHMFANSISRNVSRVAQSVQCLATGWMTGRSRFDPRERRKDFSSSLDVQIGSGFHPASCTMGTGGPFPGGKARPGRDADHSPPYSAEVKNEWELYLLFPKRLRGV
jgi:hypothetical protein